MDEIINNLFVGEILHTTAHGTEYLLIKIRPDLSIEYSIKAESKVLPIATINAAVSDFQNGNEINAEWYQNFNTQEYESRPCNLSVLENLLARINQ